MQNMSHPLHTHTRAPGLSGVAYLFGHNSGCALVPVAADVGAGIPVRAGSPPPTPGTETGSPRAALPR